MSQLFSLPKTRPLTTGGNVMPGSLLYFYEVGTTTPGTVYSDYACSVVLSQPVVADSAGQFASIYLNAARDVVLKSSSGATIYGPETVPTFTSDGVTTSNLASYTDAAKGAALVGFGSSLNYPANTVGDALEGVAVLQRGRTAPHSNFSWFTSDFTVTGCGGVGQAAVAQDIADVFLKKFSATISSGTRYVHPSGSDSNGGTNWRDAYLTLGQALRSTADGDIYVWPGTYALSDFRYTDSYGDHPKRIIAPFGGVTLRVSGQAPSALTWTLDGEFGGQYNACITTASVKPIRVLQTDKTTPDGDYLPMPLFASRASMGASSNYGWAYDASASVVLTCGTTNTSTTVTCANTKNLAVGMTITGTGITVSPATTISSITTNTSFVISQAATATNASVTLTATGNLICVKDAMSANVQTNRANFDIVYGDSSGDNRILLLSTTSYWENIKIYGYFQPLVQAGQATPQLWAKNCRMFYSNSAAVLGQGSYSYLQDCTAAYGNADGATYDTTSSVVPHAVEINYTTRWMGDPFTYGNPATLNPISTGENKNGSSNHDGYIVRINGSHTNSFGPVLGDTTGSYSWNLGVNIGHCALTPNTWPSSIRVGYIVQGGTSWVDGCSATGQDYGFNSDSSAVVYTFNTFGSTVTTSSGVFTAYTPS